MAAVACGSSGGEAPPLPEAHDFVDDIRINPSCAFECSDACGEATKPWTCPALGDWKAIPHAPEERVSAGVRSVSMLGATLP